MAIATDSPVYLKLAAALAEYTGEPCAFEAYADPTVPGTYAVRTSTGMEALVRPYSLLTDDVVEEVTFACWPPRQLGGVQ